jgi:hypothetical protein
MTSRTKLLVIMHADKIGAKKKVFLDKASSFDLNILFLEIPRRSPYHRPSNDIPKIKD